MFILGNFKNPNYELETMGANIFLSKVVLLKSIKVFYKTNNALKANNGGPCYL